MKIKVLGKDVTKARVLNAWAIFNLYQGRGSGLINQLRVNDYIILAGALHVLFPSVGVPELIVLGTLFITGTTFLGWFDYHKLKLWQLQEEKTTKYANPYYQRLEKQQIEIIDRLKRIERKK